MASQGIQRFGELFGPIQQGTKNVYGHEVSFFEFRVPYVASLMSAISLAWAELYLIIGNMFRKVDMELAGTVYVSLGGKMGILLTEYRIGKATLSSEPF